MLDRSPQDIFLNLWPYFVKMEMLRYLQFATGLFLFILLLHFWTSKRRIQSKRAKWADYRREVSYSLLTAVIFGMAGISVMMLRKMGIVDVNVGPIQNWALALTKLAVMIMAHDAWFYWLHRAMHSKLLFRIAHLLHHKSRVPTPYTAYSFAPLEAVLEALFIPVFHILTPYPNDGLMMFVFMMHMLFRNTLAHAGVELFPRWWLTTPVLKWVATTTHHDMHHQQGGYNFGFYFRFWDVWMKTEHPRYAEAFYRTHDQAKRAVTVTKADQPAAAE